VNASDILFFPLAIPIKLVIKQNQDKGAVVNAKLSDFSSKLKINMTTQPRHSIVNIPIPIAILTDSYKAGHFAQYPDATKTTAYGEFRKGFEGDKQDTRFVFYGIRYIVENYLNHKWTAEDVELADSFFKTHSYGHQPFDYPRDLFLKFIDENNGYFPIKVEALLEGTVANAHVPVFQITAEQEYAKLCTFFETILTQVWYPTCVATLSRRTRELIDSAFHECVDEADQGIAESRLHDFGFRGCTSVEQSGTFIYNTWDCSSYYILY